MNAMGSSVSTCLCTASKGRVLPIARPHTLFLLGGFPITRVCFVGTDRHDRGYPLPPPMFYTRNTLYAPKPIVQRSQPQFRVELGTLDNLTRQIYVHALPAKKKPVCFIQTVIRFSQRAGLPILQTAPRP